MNRFLVLALACLSCAIQAEEVQLGAGQGVLIDATAIPYSQKQKAGIEPKKTYGECCQIFASPGTPVSETTYSPNQAYLIRVHVDAKALASLLLKDSCDRRGIFDSSTECEPAELEKKVAETLARNIVGDLYGKYRAGFNAFEDSKLIRHTIKFGGYDVYSFKRAANGIDELVIGPMPGKPTRFVLGTDLGDIPVTAWKR